MDRPNTEDLVSQLVAGFDALQDEYKKLFEQQQTLERKLATAREQYNEVVKLYGSGATTTPPLSLASSPGKSDRKETATRTTIDILSASTDSTSQTSATKVRTAHTAASTLRQTLLRRRESISGVKIWSGRSADRTEANSSMMPSISESPLEQDFTIEGKPSKLGCPFASMAKKKLSSHAASVLSRYNGGGPGSGGAGSPSTTSTNRIDGRASFEAKRNADRRSSFVDPIKAEICGLSDHDAESPYSERAMKDHLAQQANPDVGVCPIRFLDQHSPEEVATYFERHKHELPRSHEDCVRRYQSNEQQIRELDAKYGNLVSMIQGLGAKHKDMLPEEPDETAVEEEGGEEQLDAAKIRKWASSVSAVVGGGGGREVGIGVQDEGDDEERQPRFERKLRDVRVGESPSRPWGIPVPVEYEERVGGGDVARPGDGTEKVGTSHVAERPAAKTAAKCPFDPSKPYQKTMASPKQAVPAPAPERATAPDTNGQPETAPLRLDARDSPRMIFTGPVFIGYGAEDAARILRESGLSMPG